MKKSQTIIIAVLSILIFILVYSPHVNYPYPLHIDEWHHITEAFKLKEGAYSGGVNGYRVGFHIFLLALSYFTNLIDIYQFLPGIWAVISALTLFYVVNRKTGDFPLAALSMLFFASIKSNVNITGLWFFTSLTFSIPLIFLYIFYFTEGLERQNKKYLLYSLIIMILLIFIHSISLLFALPILLLYSLFYIPFIKKEWKTMTAFVIIPVIGIIFFMIMNHLSISEALSRALNEIQFKYGWGVLELNNSFLELYSPAGYLLAIVGAFSIFLLQKDTKKFIFYLIWPAWLLLDIYIYKTYQVSFLSPYQRNLYYLALSLPFLSALGVKSLYFLLNSALRNKKQQIFQFIKKAVILLLFFLLIILTFLSYNKIPDQISVYHLIDGQGFEALNFLAKYPKATIMAPIELSSTAYPISRHEVVATIAFYGIRQDVEDFYNYYGCEEKIAIIEKYKVKYVIASEKIDCNWPIIYENSYYTIYEI